MFLLTLDLGLKCCRWQLTPGQRRKITVHAPAEPPGSGAPAQGLQVPSSLDLAPQPRESSASHSISPKSSASHNISHLSQLPSRTFHTSFNCPGLCGCTHPQSRLGRACRGRARRCSPLSLSLSLSLSFSLSLSLSLSLSRHRPRRKTLSGLLPLVLSQSICVHQFGQ